MRLALLLTAIATVALAGCATAPSVRVDRDPHADLRAYQTFAFYPSAPTEDRRYSTITAQRLEAATRRELERRGYVYDARAPQLRVNFLLNVRERHEVRSTPTAGRRWIAYGGWGGTSGLETVHYRTGTLAIDLVDAQRRALVWRGVAEGRLDGAALEQPGPVIDAAVREIFARFVAAASGAAVAQR